MVLVRVGGRRRGRERKREKERERGMDGREKRRRRREGRPQRREHVPLSSAQRTPSWQPRRRGCRDQSPVVSWDRRSSDLLSVQVQGREGGREREVTTKAIFTNAGSKVLTGVLWTPHSWNFGRRIRENCFCAVAQFAEVFHYLFLTWSGHPNMENGRSPEENQVSRTSSSEEGNYQDTTLNRTVEYTLFQDNLLFGNFEFLRSSFQCDLLGRRTAGCKIQRSRDRVQGSI